MIPLRTKQQNLDGLRVVRSRLLLHCELSQSLLSFYSSLSIRKRINHLLTKIPVVICSRRFAAWAKRHRKRRRATLTACLPHNQLKES